MPGEVRLSVDPQGRKDRTYRGAPTCVLRAVVQSPNPALLPIGYPPIPDEYLPINARAQKDVSRQLRQLDGPHDGNSLGDLPHRLPPGPFKPRRCDSIQPLPIRQHQLVIIVSVRVGFSICVRFAAHTIVDVGNRRSGGGVDEGCCYASGGGRGDDRGEGKVAVGSIDARRVGHFDVFGRGGDGGAEGGGAEGDGGDLRDVAGVGPCGDASIEIPLLRGSERSASGHG